MRCDDEGDGQGQAGLPQGIDAASAAAAVHMSQRPAPFPSQFWNQKLSSSVLNFCSTSIVTGCVPPDSSSESSLF
jgi:hypothetical protein